MRKRVFLAICLTGVGLLTAQAQEKVQNQGFSIGGHVPDQAAILDINAKNKGVLIPRIAIEKTTKLNGNNNPEGVIVYNLGTTTENIGLEAGFYYWDGSQWEKVAANTQVLEQITNLETKVTEEIKNITNIIGEPGEGGEPTDISYLVSYNPQTAVFTYLLPKEGGGYDKQVIDLKAETQKAETNTFVRPFTEKVKDGEGTKEVVSAYIYFSEDAIKTWLEANPKGNPIADMPDEQGTKMDVLGVVNNNFKEIFENNTNTEIINEIIKQSPDNVWVEERDVDGKKVSYLVYNDKDKNKHEVSLEQNETQTSMFKHTVTTAGVAAPETSTEELDAKLLDEGAIYYSYKGEHGKTFYINMTNDVINSIQNNNTLKEEIFNTVNNYTTEGGNVYYGKLDDNTEDVLYIADKDGNKTPIDISKDIEKVLQETTNNVIVEKILAQTEVKVVSGSSTKINVSIDGFNVYRGKYTANVEEFKLGAGYNTEFNEGFLIKNLETLLNVQIIKDKQVVQNSVTEVTYSGGVLKFKFGMGNLQSTLLNGGYEVIIDYVSTEESGKTPVTPGA